MKNVDLAVKELKKEFRLKEAPGLREIKNIISKMGYILLTYESSQDLLEELELIEDAKHYPSISCSTEDKNYTFYRGAVHSSDLPFILCHEIGHIYMNHINQTNGYFDTSDHKEEEANVFATRLLYPQNKKKSKFTAFLSIAFLLQTLFLFLFVGTGTFDNFKLPAEATPTQETVQSSLEQSPQTAEGPSEDTEFIDRLIIKTETAAASPKTEQPAQSVPSSEEHSVPQHTIAHEVAADVLDTSERIVVTRTGTKYHKPSCSYVRHKTDTTSYTLAEAESKYYAPCSRCF